MKSLELFSPNINEVFRVLDCSNQLNQFFFDNWCEMSDHFVPRRDFTDNVIYEIGITHTVRNCNNRFCPRKLRLIREFHKRMEFPRPSNDGSVVHEVFDDMSTLRYIADEPLAKLTDKFDDIV